MNNNIIGFNFKLCELDENVTDGKIEIIYRIKENPTLIREAQRAKWD